MKFRDYHEKLMEDLQDVDEAIGYLQAAALDEDSRVFLLALKHVIDAHKGDLSEVARVINSRLENL